MRQSQFADRGEPSDVIEVNNGSIELSIESRLEFIEVVRSVTKSVAAKMGLDEDHATWIELAVDEAVINGIIHGNNRSAVKRVDVKYLIERDAVTVWVRDRGQGFDPAQLPNPRDPENLLKPTGRGIFCMRTFMDEVEHYVHAEVGCIVRMKKYKPSSKNQIPATEHENTQG